MISRKITGKDINRHNLDIFFFEKAQKHHFEKAKLSDSNHNHKIILKLLDEFVFNLFS